MPTIISSVKNRVKWSLACVRQFQSFVRELSSAVRDCTERASALDQELLKQLTRFRLSLAPKGLEPAADGRRLLQRLQQAPREQVFPQLSGLARTWQGLQEEAVLLARINMLRERLQEHLTHLKKLPLKVSDGQDGAVERAIAIFLFEQRLLSKYNVKFIPSDEERFDEGCDGTLGSENMTEGCELVLPAAKKSGTSIFDLGEQ